MTADEVWILISRKLSGEATPDELRALEEALHQFPELHYSLQTIDDLWQPRPPFSNKAAERAFVRHWERLSAQGLLPTPKETPDEVEVAPRGGARTRWAWVAGLVSFAVLGFFLLRLQFHHNPVVAATEKPVGEFVTRNGSRTTVILPDGTHVWLNAGSRLTYDSTYGSRLREVSLTGEGFFDVVKNAKLPFVIHTGAINIRVLGTAFNVKSYPDEKTIETSLIRGSIEVTFRNNATRKILLHPNEKLVVANETIADPEAGRPVPVAAVKSEPVAVINPIRHAIDSSVVETAWVDNKLAFQDDSFGELARKMERWYGVEIRFEGPHVDTLHFTGTFRSESVEQALNALRISAPFEYRITGNQITITNKP